MNIPILIRSYADADFVAVHGLWEEAMFLDSLTREEFIRRVLLDENRGPDSLLVAEADGRVVGFLLALVLRHPIEKVGLLEKRGFITAFGVDPAWRRRGVASRLFDAAEQDFRRLGRSEVAIAPYAPNYFIPGVDREAYADAVAFLEGRGYTAFIEALAMDAAIGQLRLSPEVLERQDALHGEGVKIEPLPLSRLEEFLRFMEEVMPGDWVEAARHRLREVAGNGDVFEPILVAVDRGRIVGYCQFDGEHFGPFGVKDTHQGRGIGSVLLARTLLSMRRHGHHSAFVLWTGDRAAKGVYGKLGFQITRRFAILRKTIG